MNQITVLMTGAGAPGAYGIIQCLRNNGERDIRLVGVDMSDRASCKDLMDAFYVVPAASSPGFIDAVYDICLAEGVQVIVPIVTRELTHFSESREKFAAAGVKVSVLDKDILDIVNNKARLLSYCQENGLPTPQFAVARTADEVERALETFRCDIKPVYVKSALGNGSRGVRYVDQSRSKYDAFFNEKPDSACMGKRELLEALREHETIPEMLVMEALPGIEYSADALAKDGEIVYLAVRESPVVRSSITLESTIVKESRIEQFCTELIKSLNITGNIGFDFRADASGYPHIMEINPRLTATVVLNAAAGINFPYSVVKMMLDEPLPDLSLRYGVSVRRRYEERYTDENGLPLECF